MSARADQLGIGKADAGGGEISRELFRYLALPVLTIALGLQVLVAPHPWGWSAEVAAASALGTEALNRTHLDLQQLPMAVAEMAQRDPKGANILPELVAPAYHTELLSVTRVSDDQAEAFADLDMKLTSYLFNRTKDEAAWMTRGGYRGYPSAEPGHPLYVKLPLRIELQRDPLTQMWKLADLRGAMQGEPQFVSFWSTPGWIGLASIPQVHLTPVAGWFAAVAEYPGIFNILLVVFGLGAALCIMGRKVSVQAGGLALALVATTSALAIGPYLAWIFTI